MIAEMKGPDTDISCRGRVGEMLQMAYADCGDNEGTYLAKAANIVRRDIFTTISKFDVTFNKDTQKDSVPKTWLMLISMILNGSDLTAKNEHDLVSQNQACLSVSQMVVFNTFKRRRDLINPASYRHSKDREPPLPVHLGLRIYSQTRQSKLVDELFQLGLSISCDRVLEIENTIVRSLCTKFDEEGVVCPENLSKSVFTTSAYDNLDHDPSSTNAKEAFHGTGISIFQHPDACNTRQGRNGSYYKDDGLRKQKATLPEEYSTIKPMMKKNKNPSVPTNGSWKLKEFGSLSEVMKYGKTWLDYVRQRKKDSPPAVLSWSAFNASQHNDIVVLKSISSMLPLCKEDSHSVALMCHSMKLVQKVTAFLNPGQTPVMTFDQPLYAIAKTVQWTWPEQFGEDKLLLMLGGLNIEMAFITVIGSWLKDSGWIQALEEAAITTSGRAAAILQCSLKKRSCYAHEFSSTALYALLKDACTV